MLNSLVAFTTATIAVARLAHKADFATAAAAFWLIWYPNFCVPQNHTAILQAMYRLAEAPTGTVDMYQRAL